MVNLSPRMARQGRKKVDAACNVMQAGFEGVTIAKKSYIAPAACIMQRRSDEVKIKQMQGAGKR